MAAFKHMADFSSFANDNFVRGSGVRVPRMFLPVSLALLLSACASTKEVMEESTTPNCVDQQTYTKFISKTVKEDVEVSSKDGSSKVEQREKTVDKIVERFRINKGFNEQCEAHKILVLTAEAQQDNEVGIIASMALLFLASGQAITEMLQRYDSSLEKLTVRVDEFDKKRAIDFIDTQVGDLYRGNGQVNYPSVAAILGLYDQDSQPESKRRYPKLEQAFLRKEIDEALAARGLDIAGLKQMYEGARRNMECKTEQRNGYWQTRCGVEEPPVVYGP